MNLVERIRFYNNLDRNGKDTIKLMFDVYYLAKVGVQGHKPPPVMYRSKFENDNIRGKIIPTSDIPLEERVAGIPNELRRIFDFTVKYPKYTSRKLNYLLDRYSMMYEDYLNHFFE